MKLAHIVRERSNCMKRSVGAIVVQGNRIVSTGYNGTPGPLTNCFEGGCERCNQNKSQGVDLDKCNCIHAEENSILECGIILFLRGVFLKKNKVCIEQREQQCILRFHHAVGVQKF